MLFSDSELDLDLDLETDLDFDIDLDLDLEELDFLEMGLLLRDNGDLDRLPLDSRDEREDKEELLLDLELTERDRERFPEFGLDSLLLSTFVLTLSLSESSLIRLKSMSTNLSLSSAIFSLNG